MLASVEIGGRTLLVAPVIEPSKGSASEVVAELVVVLVLEVGVEPSLDLAWPCRCVGGGGGGGGRGAELELAGILEELVSGMEELSEGSIELNKLPAFGVWW